MKSTASDVPSYIESQPDEWQDTRERLRAACRQHLAGYSESMSYDMPSYIRDGQAKVSFVKQARYLSLYILKAPVLDANRTRLAGLEVGKGCVRFRRPDQIDWDVVASLLAGTAASASDVC